jgi:hypothetical protein
MGSVALRAPGFLARLASWRFTATSGDSQQVFFNLDRGRRFGFALPDFDVRFNA